MFLNFIDGYSLVKRIYSSDVISEQFVPVTYPSGINSRDINSNFFNSAEANLYFVLKTFFSVPKTFDSYIITYDSVVNSDYSAAAAFQPVVKTFDFDVVNFSSVAPTFGSVAPTFGSVAPTFDSVALNFIFVTGSEEGGRSKNLYFRSFSRLFPIERNMRRFVINKYNINQ